MNFYLRTVFLFFFSIVSIQMVTAQNAGTGQLISLQDYFSFLERKYQFTFSYDSDLISGVKISADTANESSDAALQNIKDKTVFDLQEAGDEVLLVKPRRPGANLRICATIVDESVKTALPSAFISNPSGAAIAVADDKGKFEVFVNLKQTDFINIDLFGFEQKQIPVEEFNGNGCPVIYLKPAVMALNPVIIKGYMGSGIDYNFRDNTIKLRPSSLGLLPGETDADVLTAIDALPGISSHDSKAGNLNIRGSSPDQSLILFDNIPIYHKGHYFGTLSPYNPAAIEEINVQRSSYMADKSGRVGGSVEIISKRNVPDSLGGGIGLSGTYASAYTYFPIVKNKAGLLVSARTSYPGNWTSPKLAAINKFIYQETAVQGVEVKPSEDFSARKFYFNDFNARFIVKPGKRDEVGISLLNISNQVTIGIKDSQLNSESYDRMILKNPGYNIDWSRTWSERFVTKVNGTQSYYSQSYISQTKLLPDSMYEDAFFRNSLDDVNFKAMGLLKLTRSSDVNMGYEFHFHQQGYRKTSRIVGKAPQDINDQNSSYLHSLFANYSYTGKEKYIINLGLRGNYYTLAGDFNLEPRIMASYFLTSDITLKSSAGLYNQYVLQIPGISIESVGGIENQLWLLADGKEIPVERSRQFMLGSVLKKRGWIFDIEAYYKKITDVSISNIVDFNSPVKYLYGSTNTIGADFLLRKNYRNFDAWMSYTLARTMMDFDAVKAEPFPSVYDQRHVFDIAASYKIRRWKFSAGWKYRSGLAALNGIRTKYFFGPPTETVLPSGGQQQQPPPPQQSGKPGTGQPKPKNGQQPPPQPGQPHKAVQENHEIYTDRYPSFHQLDISIVYAFPPKRNRWNATLGLSLQNVYNRKNIYEQMVKTEGQNKVIVNKYTMGFAPNLVFNLNF